MRRTATWIPAMAMTLVSSTQSRAVTVRLCPFALRSKPNGKLGVTNIPPKVFFQIMRFFPKMSEYLLVVMDSPM